MAEPIHTTVLGGIAAKLVTSIPSLIGSFIAILTMKFDESTPMKTKIFMGITAFFVGVVISHYGSGALFEIYPNIQPMTQDAIKVALGIFGLTLVNNVASEVAPILKSLRKKFTGDTE